MTDLIVLSGGKAPAWWIFAGRLHFLPRDGSLVPGHHPLEFDAERLGPFQRLEDVPDLQEAGFCGQCYRAAWRQGAAPFRRGH